LLSAIIVLLFAFLWLIVSNAFDSSFFHSEWISLGRVHYLLFLRNQSLQTVLIYVYLLRNVQVVF